MTERSRQWVVSVHDVMPNTLQRCEEIVAFLDDNGLLGPTLLVVPGLDWTTQQIDRLGRLQQAGAVLAGHGWNHRADKIRTPYHRLHSLLISRDVAEHLSLDAHGIVSMIRRCHAFFVEHDLEVSDLYVPPAWALGPIPNGMLIDTPFRLYETLTGVLDARTQILTRSPMIGFEADSAFRAISVRCWNRLNLALPTRSPVRFSIHPNDLSLRLADDLKRLVQAGGTNLSYDAFATASS